MAYDRYGRDRYSTRESSYGRSTEDYDDRGFFDRAGDEVRSWFGDDEAERRRRRDARYDEQDRSEEHTSELQSLMRNSYAVFCLKKKKSDTTTITTHDGDR